MAIYDAFPYTNVHELNLGFILKVVQEYTKKVDTLEIDFADLKKFVLDYFDSTDFAQLVNDKIDELVADGDFTTLFATYTTRIYNTVADMIADTLLVDGSNAQVLGHAAVNDGGAARYQITDTVPSGYYETLTNGLYAELILDDVMNIEVFGGKGDDTTDNTSALENALAYCDNIHFSAKTYFFSGQIYLTKYANIIISGDNAVLHGLKMHLNTSDGSSWYTAYSSKTVSFRGIKFLNNVETVCIRTFQPVEFIRCTIDGYARFLYQIDKYIDKFTLKEIEIRNKTGSDYTFKLDQLGDESIIEGIHLAVDDPENDDKKVFWVHSHHPIAFNNCLNGEYYIDNCNAEFRDCHFEYGTVTLNDSYSSYNQHWCTVTFDNCFFWENVVVPSSANALYVNCIFKVDAKKNKATTTINDYYALQNINCYVRSDETVNSVYSRSILRLDMNNDNAVLPWSGNACMSSNAKTTGHSYWNETANISYKYTFFPSSCVDSINGGNYSYSKYEATVSVTDTTDSVNFTVDAQYRNCFIHCFRQNLDDNSIVSAVLPNNGRQVNDFGSTISGVEWKTVSRVPTPTANDGKMVNGIMVATTSANLNGTKYFYRDSSDQIVKYKNS